ncbi:aminotransferase class I/II-fold pyridoxal phosphate-dependent enzyme [Heliorestis acidaminivorans]|uniref:Aminotransferase class I/II-fold pyridoxal phosphate-dependent enzyme n=1 Tax=Heliorestis acidaminivorans TaxID=553427 RepID=A0A6I0EX99_9FIRM|nr:aminotransferase class I/II-fold pyridoxal phosphate-dependent enzyme [Heliorestis acidaminivorans]KAB2951824.1 aminotransferase class I/II-fold pyridoxal phosphate-dependent enzyme [Heliorestis acidaminivorans]
MRIETLLAQLGNGKDHTGAISYPIYPSATYRHPALGESTGFDYSRSGNPTRKVLEEAIAQLEKGKRGLAFSSGMAAIASCLSLFKPGDHLILCQDLYGGTYRLVEQVYGPLGLTATYVDTRSSQKIREAIRENTKAILVETPTNPTMHITDLKEMHQICKDHDLLMIVDNTFMSPYLQRPIEVGAHIVIHSGTKYLGGHNDVVAGLVVTATEELGEKLYFYQNAIGAVLGPFDAWLLLRGMKSLALRMEQSQASAQALAQWLQEHKEVEQVYYLGLPEHPGREVHFAQASGAGAMVSFALRKEEQVEQVLSRVQLISFAESLGGVESLITFPAKQTHGDIPEELRLLTGVTSTLLRLSVGIENVEDLIADLDQALRD